MRWVWALAFAGLFAASFPFRAGELRFDAGVVAGWLALAPLALLLRGLGPRAAFTWATGAATLGFAGVVFWLYVVVATHGGAHPAVAALAVLVMSLLCALHVGAAAALAAWLEPRAGRLALFVLPAAWVVAEHLRGFLIFGGFPWAFLGYSAHANGPVRELAALVGVYGLSFALALFACALARGRSVVALTGLAAVHAAGFALGLAALGDAAPGGARRVALVQGNIPQGLKWDAAFADESFQRHVESSRLAAAAGEVDLIVWPEAAATVPLDRAPWREQLAELARETGASLLVGSMAIEPRFPGARAPGDFAFHNSVYALRPDGAYVDRYDKARLVPFGEYLPLRPFLSLFIEALARGAAFADITPGPGPRTLEPLPGYGPGAALSPLICYEIIYPSLVRRAVRGGARILVNVTNDAWYGRTSAPHQFFAIAAMRSAEHGLPLIRAANTGVSGIVAPGGRVLETTPIFEPRALATSVPPGRSGVTLYTRLGDWVVWACWVFLGALAVAGVAGVTGTSGKSRAKRTDGADGGQDRVGSRRGTGNPGAARGSRGEDARASEASLTSTRSARA